MLAISASAAFHAAVAIARVVPLAAVVTVGLAATFAQTWFAFLRRR